MKGGGTFFYLYEGGKREKVIVYKKTLLEIYKKKPIKGERENKRGEKGRGNEKEVLV